MPGEAYDRIYGLAADQLGYFTTRQAREAGVSARAVVMMGRRSVVERVSHGVYRLAHFPISPLAQYAEASLWPLVVEGIVSHESALALYGLSDVNPGRVHISVPTAFRVRRDIPAGLRIHHADIPPGDWHYHEGIAVTTPARTIRDCHAAALGDALIRQAIRDGAREGFLSTREAERLTAELLISEKRRETR